MPCHIPGGVAWCGLILVGVGVLWVVLIQAGARVLGKSKLIAKYFHFGP